jgi:polyferredoxin
MKNSKLIRNLKVIIVMGICLLLLGHYFISYAKLPETMGVKGMIISAGCIALGLILSLPTKIYLTILLMQREGKISEIDDHQRD